MNLNVLLGIFIPFFGTTVGAMFVFFVKDKINVKLEKGLLGFASGVMVAASVWSLLIPSMNYSEHMGKFAFIPAVVGLLLGMGFLLLMDQLLPHLHINECEPEGLGAESCKFKRTTMMVFAVILHNIPEGMAVGVVFAGLMSGSSQITLAGAFALSIGIAIQNVPEGAIVSMPLKTEGNMSRKKAFLIGSVSGLAEPLGSLITIALIAFIQPLLPYFLSFAAGAMLYVVVEELIPETARGKHSNIGTVGFAVGFAIMMTLDVALG